MAKKVNKEKKVVQQPVSRQNFFQKTAGFFVRTGKKLKNFFVNLKAELKRVVWPDRRRLIQSTATVLAICVLIGIVLFIVDSMLGGLLNAMGFYSPNVPAPTTAATTTATTAVQETSETDEQEEQDTEADG